MKNLNANRRVVVTGLGVVSSLGIGWQEFWPNLLAGKSGISEISRFDTSSYDRHFAGEIKNFTPERYLSQHKIKHLGRSSQFAIIASKFALIDANFNKNMYKNFNIATCIGTTMGESRILEYMDEMLAINHKDLINNLNPLTYPGNSILTNLIRYLHLDGENYLFANACAAGNYALGNAYDLIKSGRTDYVLAGGVDSFSRVAFSGFERIYALAPEKCQPFDRDRKGMIPGEGAGILFLETFESAQRRNAPQYAEILGYGLSCDGHHMTNPDPQGVAKAIQKSLLNSNVKTTDVSYISAHGTGTPENDKAECEAFHAVFNSRANKIPVSSIKSMLGHTMGAAAALESIACCLAIKFGEIPPTINFENRDPLCDIDCVPNKSRKHRVNIALNNSQAFGGNNACLILKGVLDGEYKV